jgi:hypothetical protein
MRVVGRSDLHWKGNVLYRNSSPVAEVIPDATYPAMWRVQLPGEPLTDMVNLSRAKEAAMSLVLHRLNPARRKAAPAPH